MKVGTDAVLLGAWAEVSDAASILDIGTGTGILALMTAQRTESTHLKITAVEIDNGAYHDAFENISKSRWCNRIELLHSSFTSVNGCWDLIISNPPFFSSPLKSPLESRAMARHAGELNYFTLIKFASGHLTPGGSLAMISDLSESSSEIIYCAEMHRLKVRRICKVLDHEGGVHIRTLWQFKKNDGPIEKSEIAIRTSDNNTLSDEFKILTNHFYLDNHNGKSK
ncbi:MAG: methyltransferase [Muribaculaceae bacterium]|nr:methyltransferase [Muribaculaceae bacterium]